MARCLVLGANGFIGSHLVDSLVAKGHNVRAFDRFGKNIATNFFPDPKVEVVAGDFLNRYDLSKALEDIDYVFHFISTTTPMSAENDPLIDIETNIRMSVELFQECVAHKIKKVIFASTGGAIYGDTKTDEPIPETMMPNPISPYAIGKLTIENYLHYFHVKHGLNALVFRISNPYGARQSLNSKQGVIPIFLQHIANDEPITVLGDGSMVRDYIYVDDVAKMIAATFESAKKTLYNLGSGHGVTVNQLKNIIEELVKKDLKVKHEPNPSTFIEKVVLDTSLFQNEFAIYPTTDLKEGINKTWEYVLSSNNPHNS